MVDDLAAASAQFRLAASGPLIFAALRPPDWEVVSRSAAPLLVWASLLTLLAAVLWEWSSDHLPPAIFTAAAGVAWLVALYALLRPGRRPRMRVRPELDLSFSSVLVAFAIAMLVL